MTSRRNIPPGIVIREAEDRMGTDSKQACHSESNHPDQDRGRAGGLVQSGEAVGFGRDGRIRSV